MLKKTSLAILIGLSVAVVGFSIKLYAEGDHEHKHIDAGNNNPDHQNHAGMHWASPQDASIRTNPIKSDKDSIARGAKS